MKTTHINPGFVRAGTRGLPAATLRRWAVGAALLVVSLAASAADNVTVPGKTYPSGQGETVVATSTITTSTNTVVVSSGANITYIAGTKVTLGPGFHAASGARFRAFAGDSDSDGLPDSWEIAMFGSLAQGATGNPDSDTITNLTEFYLGTNPTVANSADGSNQSQLEIHRPIP